MLQIRILRGHLMLQCKRLLLNTKYFKQCRQIVLSKHLLFKSNIELPLILRANRAGSEESDEFLQEMKHSPIIQLLDEIHNPKRFEKLNSSDVMMMHIIKCETLSTLFSFVRENSHIFNAAHVCHALLMTRELQRNNKEARSLLSESNYDYIQILDLVSHHNKEFTLDEVTWSLLAIAASEVPVQNETFQLLLSRFHDYVEKLQDDIPLINLARYSLAIQNFALEHWTYCISLPIFNLVLNKLHGCTTAVDMYLCTLCLNIQRELVTDSVLSSYQMVVQNLLNKNKLHAGNSDILLAILTFLNRPDWRLQCNNTMRNIMLQFHGKVHLLDVNILVELIKIFSKLQEPSCLLDEFQNSAFNFLSENVSTTTKSSLARYLIPFTFGPSRQKFQKLLNKNLHIQSTENDISVQNFVKLYQTFKTPVINTFYTIWTKMQSLITSNNPEVIERLLQLCFSYTYYVDRYSNLHRHLGFEKEMLKWLMNDLQNGECNFITWKCTRATGFTLAYYPTNESKDAIPDIVIDKLLSFSEQYSVFHCFYITQCLRIARKIRKDEKKSTKLINQLNQIDQMLDECMERLLKSETLDVTHVTLLMRCCAYREFEKENEFFKKIEQRTKETDSNITSQIIREVTSSITQNQYVLPHLIEKVVKYIINNREYVLAQTVAYFTNSCYTLGYTPKDITEFTAVVNEIIYRERHRITGKLIIETALTLCYFQHLSSDLIRFIFTMDFLQALDDEIILNKAHLSYPSRVRNSLMKLNRAVCIEFPEEDVPWFHRRYCEEEATRDYRNPRIFHKEVDQTLAALVDEKNIRVNAYSPYYHKIDFLVQNKESKKNFNDRGTALILHGPNSFSNNGTYLKGVYEMNKRQLQILGYNVITLNHYIWNSMALSESSAKLKYLSDCLQGKSEKAI
ncbi:FAST kinase domain-containing protein 1, mitochondrial [Cephus cinctus]|uniref:FAST kinase domain-containing protein 1, mitochondrial n=1 Tax=Cephus cinctus TaxID=211228 RepID=A0AAJ7FSH9_CEPCN|nr:FAST kinase domain-containing protein 1, mitochondrial [Cephus cinctus]